MMALPRHGMLMRPSPIHSVQRARRAHLARQGLSGLLLCMSWMWMKRIWQGNERRRQGSERRPCGPLYARHAPTSHPLYLLHQKSPAPIRPPLQRVSSLRVDEADRGLRRRAAHRATPRRRVRRRTRASRGRPRLSSGKVGAGAASRARGVEGRRATRAATARRAGPQARQEVAQPQQQAAAAPRLARTGRRRLLQRRRTRQ